MHVETWLNRREPYDHGARYAPFADALASALPHPAPQILDLAAGHGGNARYLRPRLPADSRWIGVDDDRSLLDLLDADCVPLHFDLRGDLDSLPTADALVCSALLDIVDKRFWRARREELGGGLRRCRRPCSPRLASRCRSSLRTGRFPLATLPCWSARAHQPRLRTTPTPRQAPARAPHAQRIPTTTSLLTTSSTSSS